MDTKMTRLEKARTWQREYYRRNREELCKLYECDCGCKISKNSKAKHVKTIMHLEYMVGYNNKLKLLEMINNTK